MLVGAKMDNHKSQKRNNKMSIIDLIYGMVNDSWENINLTTHVPGYRKLPNNGTTDRNNNSSTYLNARAGHNGTYHASNLHVECF